jgi:hypothetical protein
LDAPKSKFLKSVIVILFIFVGLTLQAQAPKYSNDFLTLGVHARGLAMGGAMVAQSNDVSSGFWNPAGLARMENYRQVSLMHAEYFSGIANYDYLGFGFQVNEQSGASINLIRLGIDNIPNTLALIEPSGNVNYNNITSFSATDFALMLGYGAKNDRGDWSFGGNAKIIRRRVGNFGGAWGFGADVGAQYQDKYGRKLGVSLKDLGSTVNFWQYKNQDSLAFIFTTTGNSIPKSSTEITLPRLIVGGGYHWEANDYLGVTGELDLVVTSDGKRNTLISGRRFGVDPMAGLEVDYQSTVFLRAGINQFQRNALLNVSALAPTTTFSPNLGVGIKTRIFQLDYALTNAGNQNSFFSHIISLSVGLDPE